MITMTKFPESLDLVVNEPQIIIIHCSDTPDSKDFDIEDIRRWHTDKPPNGNGWRDVGYHYIIKRDGTIQMGRLETEVGAHVRSHNRGSIGVCLIGRERFNQTQYAALDRLYIDIYLRHGLDSRDVYGHYELDDRKTCPNLDMDKIRYRFMHIIKGLQTS